MYLLCFPNSLIELPSPQLLLQLKAGAVSAGRPHLPKTHVLPMRLDGGVCLCYGAPLP